MAKPWWRKPGGGLDPGWPTQWCLGRAAQRPTGAPGGRAWSPLEMVRLQPAPEARAAPPYPRPAASGELPRMGKRRTVGRVSTGQFARSLIFACSRLSACFAARAALRRVRAL